MWTQNVSIGYTKKYQLNLKTLGKYIYIYIYKHTYTQTLGSLKPECLDFTPKDMLLFLKNVEVHNMGINISQ